MLALVAAGVAAPASAQDCTAAPSFIGSSGLVSSVSVSCSAGDQSETFATSFSGTVEIDDISPIFEPVTYDGTGADTFIMTGGQIVDGAGTDTPVLVLDGDAPPEYLSIDGNLDPSADFIEMLGGDDTVIISGGQIGSEADPVSFALGDGSSGSGADADFFQMTGGTVWGGVFGLGGGNTYDLSGDAVINGQLFAGSQDDTVEISGDAIVRGVNNFNDPDAVALEDGDDVFTMTGGTVAANVSAGSGDDLLTISGGTIFGLVTGQAGDDEIEISGTANLASFVTGFDGDDTITVSGGFIAAYADGGSGDDGIVVTGGSIGQDVEGGAGDDSIRVEGGSIGGSVIGGAGIDDVTVLGGTISGDIDAGTVRLFGGTIGGDILGLSGNTLEIEDPDGNLNLRNGVLFSGTNATGTITNTDLARAAGGAFRSQNFDGFSSLLVTNSQIGLAPAGIAEIDLLTLTGGSTLFANGAVNLTGQGGGFGDLNVNGSTINLVNGSPADILRVGDLTLNGATLAVDVDQQQAISDRIAAATLATNGTNTFAINLLGTPVLGAATEIPIITASGQPITGNFVVTGVPDTAAALFNYAIVPDTLGGLLLQATPSNAWLGAATQVAINSRPPEVVAEAVTYITGNAIDSALGLAPGGVVAVTPTMGVFASGQFARVDHDGFSVSSDNFNAQGPSFTSDDFSAAISVDWNAAKHLELDQQYGLNLGLFGGYASADVDLGAYQGFSSVGNADNGSGMVGGYGLFRQGFNYVLVSATGFFGTTDIYNDVFDSTGSYDTTGFAFTASAGRIFVLSDRMRFDLRGGILGVSFEGDGYTDSAGVDYGKSTVSFGAVKFEPGVYADYQWENGMIFSPYLRGELQQRFSYKNESELAGITYGFDDADFSAAISAGFNLKTSDRFTVSSEVRAKASEDSSTIAGKLGVKIAF